MSPGGVRPLHGVRIPLHVWLQVITHRVGRGAFAITDQRAAEMKHLVLLLAATALLGVEASRAPCRPRPAATPVAPRSYPQMALVLPPDSMASAVLGAPG